MNAPAHFSPELQNKIDSLTVNRKKIQLGQISFDSPFLLAPMAAICNAPFRLLMQDLGAGGSVSELISSHGINFANERTLNMLRIDPQEKNVGIQLFGESPESMAQAAPIAQEHCPDFLDINMGCPVKKVVTKGGGSALMKDLKLLQKYIHTMKKNMTIPLTIKIRTGWDQETRNAQEVLHIAKEEGVEFVAIHGRTRCQQYRGQADWDYMEQLAQNSPIPLVGNGDLHQAHQVVNRYQQTQCQALMIARGALRNPFIFLETQYLLDHPHEKSCPLFKAKDYWEVINRLHYYIVNTFEQPLTQLVQIRKLIVWFSAGFQNVAAFRGQIFECKKLEEMMNLSQDYFLSLDQETKFINFDETFMTSGHG